MTHSLSKQQMLDYLRLRRAPLTEPAGSVHADLLAADPTLYTGIVRDPAADLTHKREVVARFVCSPAAGLPRLLHDLWSLDPVEGLSIIEAVRARRLNGRRARTFGLQFLLGHPRLAHLAATRRQRLVRLLKHLLGERTWSAATRSLASAQRAEPWSKGERFLRRHLLRHARDVGLAREVLTFLAGLPLEPSDPSLQQVLATRVDLKAGEGLPAETLYGLRATYHPAIGVREARALAPAAERTHGVGPVTALHKQALTVWFEGGSRVASADTTALQTALRTRLQEASTWLPAVEARVAVVLDLSASVAGSGERYQHGAALGLALVRLLEASCARLSVHQVGGAGSVHEHVAPRPEGWGDLATAVLNAARDDPALILVVTDGYENRRQGDVAEVVRGVRHLDPSVSVVQVTPRFTRTEDLRHRRLSASVPLLPVDHEEDVRELSAQAVLAGADEALSHTTTQQLQELLFSG